jgi:flagellar motor switch protein FliN/FliY
MSLHPDVQRFATLLRKIESLLSEHGEVHWAAKIVACLSSVERSDAHGLYRFLSFFGGMGSLNDVVLSRDNDMLRAALSQAWELGNSLARDEKQ